MQYLESQAPDLDFLWMAEYNDDTSLIEYDPETSEYSNFYDIDKDCLSRFGIFGYGMKLYYEVYGGIYKVAGNMIEIIYRENDKDYYLTGQQQFYNDIIQFKTGAFDVNPLEEEGVGQTSIVDYNFGYKQKLKIDDTEFDFKTIFHLPIGSEALLNIRLVADRNLSGKLIIKKNGQEIESYEAPLKANYAGELAWKVVI